MSVFVFNIAEGTPVRWPGDSDQAHLNVTIVSLKRVPTSGSHDILDADTLLLVPVTLWE